MYAPVIACYVYTVEFVENIHDDDVLGQVLADNATADYVDIIGYHWYLNFITPGTILDSVHKDFPDKPIINTEACNGRAAGGIPTGNGSSLNCECSVPGRAILLAGT